MNTSQQLDRQDRIFHIIMIIFYELKNHIIYNSLCKYEFYVYRSWLILPDYVKTQRLIPLKVLTTFFLAQPLQQATSSNILVIDLNVFHANQTLYRRALLHTSFQTEMTHKIRDLSLIPVPVIFKT